MGDGQLDHPDLGKFQREGRYVAVYDYRRQSWYGLQGNIGGVLERKDHMVAHIIEKYIIGTK